MSLQWRNSEFDGIWNHQPHDCLLEGLFSHRLKKTSNHRVTGLCEGNWPVDSPHKGQVTRKIFPFHDVVIWCRELTTYLLYVSPLFGNLVWTRCEFDTAENLNILLYISTLFPMYLHYFNVSNGFYFNLSTIILLFEIDIVLAICIVGTCFRKYELGVDCRRCILWHFAKCRR